MVQRLINRRQRTDDNWKVISHGHIRTHTKELKIICVNQRNLRIGENQNEID
jgi:adenylate kinase family enzyme